MEMKNPIKNLKRFFAAVLTTLVVIVLFGIIFVRTGLSTPNSEFFIELGVTALLTIMMRLWWYDFAEDKQLDSEELKQKKETYFKSVDTNVVDTNDLDVFLKELNEENKEHYITNKMGCRTIDKLSKNLFWYKIFHCISCHNLTDIEIGTLRYNRLYYKYQRKADKIEPITSENLMSLSDKELLYDAKNYLKERKRWYQISTAFISCMLSVFWASLMLEDILLNWANVFKFLTYLCSMAWASASSIMKADKTTKVETLDYFDRLLYIIDKYATYKKKNEEEILNGCRVNDAE